MEKNLYCVRVVLYVMAENEADACVAATQARFDIFECTARKAKIVNPDWKNAIPYNADDERTCSEIMRTRQNMTVPVATLKLPAYVETGVRAIDLDNHLIQPGQQT